MKFLASLLKQKGIRKYIIMSEENIIKNVE